MRQVITSILFILSLASAVVAGPFVNGSFEPSGTAPNWQVLPGGSTAIPGWVTTDTGVEWFLGTHSSQPGAADGLYVVDLANYTYSAGGIRQTFDTVPGLPYNVTFMLGTCQVSGRDGTCQITVSADGQSQTFSAVNHAVARVWEPKTFTFVADDAMATLWFRCLQNANQHFANLDAVILDAPVPSAGETWGAIKALYR